MRYAVRLVVDIARIISRQIELESMRGGCGGELMKPMHLLQPGHYRPRHKLSWLQVQHCPQSGSFFFPAWIQRRDFEMESMVNHLLFRTRNDADVVLRQVWIVRQKELGAARRQTLRKTSGDETLVARAFRIVRRQAGRHTPIDLLAPGGARGRHLSADVRDQKRTGEIVWGHCQ